MSKMICIECPRGCRLEVEEGKVRGNECPRGIKYALSEISCPQRNLTSTVRLYNGELAVVPVKTSGSIPKDKMFVVMEELRTVVIYAPVSLGDIVVKNILNLGVDIVATRSIKEVNFD